MTEYRQPHADRVANDFELWDMDGDGRVTRDDWEAKSKRLVRTFAAEPGSPYERDLTTAYLGIWSFLAGKAGIDEHTGQLSFDAFYRVVDDYVLNGDDKGFDKAAKAILEVVTQAVDWAGNGSQLTFMEFSYWPAIDFAKNDAMDLFGRFDTDGDGVLTADDVVNTVRSYYAGELSVHMLWS